MRLVLFCCIESVEDYFGSTPPLAMAISIISICAITRYPTHFPFRIDSRIYSQKHHSKIVVRLYDSCMGPIREYLVRI